MDTSKTVQNALAGTKTEELLKQAARGEAQAFTKYMLFAGLAGEEGYEPIRTYLPRLPATKKNTPSCGTAIWTNSARAKKT